MFNDLPKWLERLQKNSASSSLEKAIHGDRLTPVEIAKLIEETPFYALSAAADFMARTEKRNRGSFTVNIYLTYTNVCTTSCSFCAFYSPPGSPNAYVIQPKRLAEVAKKAEENGIMEIHMVGGNNPDLPFDYYEKLISSIKERTKKVTLKAFTAEEIWFIAKNTGQKTREVLERFKELGLDSLSGGGAEVLDEEVQKIIAPKKVSPEEYLRIHEEAHKVGIKSNVTLMYGHIEDPINVARHLYRVRSIENRSPGFISFIPVRFNPGNTPLGRSDLYKRKAKVGGKYDLRIIASSRLALLGAIDNIVAYWVAMGEKLAQAALNNGANDLGGTFYQEAVISATGSFKAGKRPDELAFMMAQAGWEPWLRNTFYNYINRINPIRVPWMDI
ncbi:MAG: radical SAM protein [Caldisphaeraceae archaeon]|nr:radical SAM protein [Caldisphaeraceae archaeon]MEB3691670.1 radical SAM protein [Caldisphaeraceae archaeon]MEB3798059.1 radical SAM protein [Caldisphaeraceae archaeon]